MKTMNRIVTGVLVIALAVAGCGCRKAEYYKYDGKANIKHYDQEEFLSAIHPIMNAKTGGSFSTNLDNMATVSWQDCAYIQFTNPDEARDMFQRFYDNYDEAIRDEVYVGKMECAFSEDQGYMIYDLVPTHPNQMESDEEFGAYPVYGGFFYNGDMFVCVEIQSKEGEDFEIVNKILDNLDYPRIKVV